MPNRIIRESALTSHSLAKLSDGAERLFWRLTLVADDQGRFDAFPATVKANCFPTMVDTLKTSKVHAWMMELAEDHCGFYTINGRQYGHFRKWAEYQRIYGIKSKFPQPPADCGELPQAAADSRSYSYLESRIENRESILAHQWVSGFEEFWKLYPRKAGKGAAERAWAKIRPDEQLRATIQAAIQRAMTSADWVKDNGQYIPHPATWLNQKRWEDEMRPPGAPVVGCKWAEVRGAQRVVCGRDVVERGYCHEHLKIREALDRKRDVVPAGLVNVKGF